MSTSTVYNEWVIKNVFGFSEEEIKRNHDQVLGLVKLWVPPVSATDIAELQLEKAIRDHDQGTHPS